MLLHKLKLNLNMDIIQFKLVMVIFQVKALTQPELGHLQKSNIQPLKYLKEFKVNETDEFKVGQVLNVDSFSPGQLVNIRGKSIR